MSKISEKIRFDDMTGKMIVQQSHDYTPVIEKAKSLKSAGLDGASDNKLVGLVPLKMWAEWAKKWGVSVSDKEAMKEVVAKELMSSDNAHLRVWDGKF